MTVPLCTSKIRCQCALIFLGIKQKCKRVSSSSYKKCNTPIQAMQYFVVNLIVKRSSEFPLGFCVIFIAGWQFRDHI